MAKQLEKVIKVKGSIHFKMKEKKYLFYFIIFVFLIWLLFRALFSYTIITWGGDYKKHKVFSVEFFPYCWINPLKYYNISEKINSYILSNKYDIYYNNNYLSYKRGIYYTYFKQQVAKTSFYLVSIRDNQGYIEILIFTNKQKYDSLILKLDPKTKQIVGYY